MKYYAVMDGAYVVGIGRCHDVDLGHNVAVIDAAGHLRREAAADTLIDDQFDAAENRFVRGRAMADLVADKQAIIANGSDTALITGIPANAQVALSGLAGWQDVPDGHLEVTSLIVGTLIIRLRAPGYRPTVLTIEVVNG